MELYFLVLTLSTALSTAAAHYFPYWMFLAGGKLPNPKNLIARYVAGTLSWVLPFSVWLVMEGYTRIVVACWIFLVTAGITVVLLYIYDAHIATKQAAQDRKELVDLLERRRDAKEKGTR